MTQRRSSKRPSLPEPASPDSVSYAARDSTPPSPPSGPLWDSIPKMFRNNQDALFIIQHDVVVDCNDAGVTMTGFPREEIIGKPPYLFFHERQHNRQFSKHGAQEKLEKALRGQQVLAETIFHRGDGNLYDAEIILTLMEDMTPPTVLGLARDITPRKHAERVAAIMLGISRAVSSTHDLPSLYECIHELLHHHIMADSMFIGLLDEAHEALTVVYSSDNSDKPVTILNVFDTRSPSLSAEVVRTASPVLMRGQEIDRFMASKGGLRFGFHAAVWLGVPLRIDGKVKGVLGLQHYSDPYRFSRREADLLTAVSEQTALAIERKQRDDALQRSQTLFNAFMDNIPALAFIKDTDGKYTFANHHYQRYLGISPQERLGRTDREIWPDLYEQIIKNDQEVLRTGIPLTSLEQIRVHGQPSFHQVTKFPILDDVRIAGVGGVAFDVTVLRKTRENLEHALEKYASLVDNALEGIFSATTDGVLTSANKAMTQLFGYSSPEALLLGLPSLLDMFERPEDGRSFLELLRLYESVEEFEVPVSKKDGTRVWVSLSAQVITQKEGKKKVVEGLALDVTDRKMREFSMAVRLEISDALESEERLKNLYSTIHNALGRYINADNFYIALLNEENDCLTFPYVVDEKDNVFHTLEHVSQNKTPTATLDVVRASSPLLLTIDDADRFLGTPPQAWLGMPLRVRDKTIGAIVVQSYYDRNCYSPRDVDLLAAAADQIALGIERKLHRDELQRAHDALEKRVRERTAELKTAKDQAEDAVRTKSAFLANMTHEIRTPINAVMGMVSLLKDTPLSGRQKELLSIMESSSKNLLQLVNHVLDFSKAEAGKLQFEKIDFSPTDVAEEAATMFQNLTRTRPLEFILDLDPKLPGRIQSDPLRLHQVLQNLLSNAFKFTQKGQVVLSIRVVREDSTTCTLRFSVEDSGCGVSQDMLPRLFDPFTQEDSSIARTYGGTGLGLSISKSIVTGLGGKIWAQSTPGKGSTFAFEATFPISLESDPASVGPLAGKRICIVDPLKISRGAARSHLAAQGMNVVAYALPGDIPTDTACDLLYIRAPYKDSPQELARLAGRRLADPDVPAVLAGTPLPNVEVPEQPGRIFLDKPVRPSVLTKAIARILIPSVTPVAKPSIDAPLHPRIITGLHVLVAEDNEVNSRVAREFLHSAGAIPYMVENGRQAVEAVHNNVFDLVLMDVRMPIMDGIEAARTILASMGGQAPPIVAMTAQALDTERDRCFAAGMAGFISKPIDRNLFYEIIAQHTAQKADRTAGFPASPQGSLGPQKTTGAPHGIADADSIPAILDMDDAMVRFDQGPGDVQGDSG